MKKTLATLNFPPVLIAMVIIFSAIDLVILGNSYDLSKSDWAAWVQAVGSIAAIFVAALIASWQIKKSTAIQQDIRADEAKIVVLAVLTLTREYSWATGLAIGNLVKAMKSEWPTTPGRPAELYTSLDDALRAIPLHELPNAKVVKTVAGVRHHISHTRNTIVNAWDGLGRGPIDGPHIRAEILAIKANMLFFLTELETELQKMGGDPEDITAGLEARLIWNFVENIHQ